THPDSQSLADKMREQAEAATGAATAGAQSLADRLSQNASAGESDEVAANLIDRIAESAEQALDDAHDTTKSIAEKMREQQKKVDETEPKSLADQIRERTEQDDD